VNPEVTIEPGGFFPAHHHPPRSNNPHDEVEIYQVLKGTLEVWLRPPNETQWRTVYMMQGNNDLLAIPAGWHHAGRVYGDETVVFVPYTRADHLLTNDFGGNIKLLPDDQQPPPILHRIKAQRNREQAAQS